jgi:basic membrane lipoprotein Med (substrate-binding protein (PBP1-ABC) superfamily)
MKLIKKIALSMSIPIAAAIVVVPTFLTKLPNTVPFRVWEETDIKNNTSTNFTLVTDGGSVFDKSFNESGYDALAILQPGTSKFSTFTPKTHTINGILAKYISAHNLGYNTVLAPGFYHAGAISNYFSQNIDGRLRFVLLDADYNYGSNPRKDAVASIVFDMKTISFVTGYLISYYLSVNQGKENASVGM